MKSELYKGVPSFIINGVGVGRGLTGGPGSGRARASARISSRGGGRQPSYMTAISRGPFPFATDLMPNTLAFIANKRTIGFVLPIMLFRG